MKAISLFSGGLDSMLSIKLILNQNIEVVAVNFQSVFYSSASSEQKTNVMKNTAKMLGAGFKTFDISHDLREIIKNPKHGHGSNVNPCIDCHAFMFKKAGEYMKEINASFLVTGEVLGERPMSQRKEALKIVEKESGLEGLILRPLSAKLLSPTIPEEKGWVDREKLLNIEGRSRKAQMNLAKEFGIDKYPSPAGGCLLTDPGFARRMKDLMSTDEDFTIEDAKLLKVGRHFRLSPEAKLVVGRNEKENKILQTLKQKKDYYFYPANTTGPDAIGRGIFSKDLLQKACSIVARYSDSSNDEEVEISYNEISNEKTTPIKINPAENTYLDSIRI